MQQLTEYVHDAATLESRRGFSCRNSRPQVDMVSPSSCSITSSVSDPRPAFGCGGVSGILASAPSLSLGAVQVGSCPSDDVPCSRAIALLSVMTRLDRSFSSSAPYRFMEDDLSTRSSKREADLLGYCLIACHIRGDRMTIGWPAGREEGDGIGGEANGGGG
jgi:hypothetical protein